MAAWQGVGAAASPVRWDPAHAFRVDSTERVALSVASNVAAVLFVALSATQHVWRTLRYSRKDVRRIVTPFERISACIYLALVIVFEVVVVHGYRLDASGVLFERMSLSALLVWALTNTASLVAVAIAAFSRRNARLLLHTPFALHCTACLTLVVDHVTLEPPRADIVLPLVMFFVALWIAFVTPRAFHLDSQSLHLLLMHDPNAGDVYAALTNRAGDEVPTFGAPHPASSAARGGAHLPRAVRGGSAGLGSATPRRTGGTGGGVDDDDYFYSGDDDDDDDDSF